MGKFTIKVVNHRDEKNLDLLLTVAGTHTGFDGGPLQIGQPIAVADFLRARQSFSAEVLDSCRLYVGYGLSQVPDPNGTQYYGWIEFSKATATDGLWINLTNVDTVGLPLALEGVGTDGKPFTLGYQETIVDIITALKNRALTGRAPDAAIKRCDNGSERIIAPNIQFPAYGSYQTYIDALTRAGAKLTIHTDTPIGASQKVFTGNFSGSDATVTLTSAKGDTFAVLKDQFTTEYLYRCDGGTVVYNGKTVNMNRPDNHANDAEAVYTNSLFRLLCVGINEGYFTPDGANDSSLFPKMKPFANSSGNVYAEVLHTMSDSYGYPYADGNLKTLVEAGGDSTVTLTIMRDDETSK